MIGVPFYTVSPRGRTCAYETKRLHPSVKTCGVTLLSTIPVVTVRSTSPLNASRISGVLLNGTVVYFHLKSPAVNGLLTLHRPSLKLLGAV